MGGSQGVNIGGSSLVASTGFFENVVHENMQSNGIGGAMVFY